MPEQIAFPTSSYPALFGTPWAESQGRLLNCYLEQEKEQAVWKRIPGLQRFTDVGVTNPRGFMESDGYVYGAYEDTVVKIGDDRAVTALTGVLPGIDRVTWAKNNQLAEPPRGVVVCCEAGIFQVTPTAVTAYPTTFPPPYEDDGAFPPNPTSVAHLDGYIFATYANGQIWATGLNTLAVNGSSFTTAESNPDGLLRGIVSGRQLFAMGPVSIEVYQNVGATPFPLARTAVIPVGLIGTFAAAGGNETDGWDSAPLFVAADGTVRQLAGYEPRIVSTRTIERWIAQEPDPTQLTAYVSTLR